MKHIEVVSGHDLQKRLEELKASGALVVGMAVENISSWELEWHDTEQKTEQKELVI